MTHRSPPEPAPADGRLRILGVDPGSRVTGWGLVGGVPTRPRLLEHGVIRLVAAGDLATSRPIAAWRYATSWTAVVITAASEIVMLLAFEINTSQASGLLSLCYPFFTLESILPRLGQQSYVRSGRMDQEMLRGQNLDRLNKTYVQLKAELARGRATFRELQGLRVGDVMPLDSTIDQKTVLYVQDEPKFEGIPGRKGRKNAVLITNEIDTEDESLFKNRSRAVLV